MTKKVIGAFIALTLLLGLVAIPFVFASQAEFVVSSASGEAGDEVEIEITVSNNPGIAGFILTLEFDSELLEFDEESFTPGEILADGKVETNFNEPDADVDSIKIVWYCAEDFTEDGVVFTMTFTISEDAPAGEIPIAITVEAINALLDELAIDAVDGGVFVNAPTPTPDPDETPTPDPDETPAPTPTPGDFDGDFNRDGWIDIDDLIWLVDTAKYTDIDDVLSLLDSDIFNK